MATKRLTSAFINKSLFAVVLATAFGAYADSADAPAPHSDSAGAAVSDTVITAKVKSQFLGEDRLKNSDISVTTTNGVVTLTGSAPGPDAKSDAERLARSVGGVKSVDDELRTPAAGPVTAKVDRAAAKTRRAVSDSWITTKVKSEILADSVSKGFDVSVKTRHGVVVLKGALASQDAIDHVKDIAEKVKGVKSVDTTLRTVSSS